MTTPFLLPPVVGEVSSCSALILTEINRGLQYRVYQHFPSSDIESLSIESISEFKLISEGWLEPQSDTIVRLKLTNLQSDTQYQVRWYFHQLNPDAEDVNHISSTGEVISTNNLTQDSPLLERRSLSGAENQDPAQMSTLQSSPESEMTHARNQSVIYTNRVQTLTPSGPRTLAVCACDLPAMQTGPNLWAQLAEQNPDMVLHIGDNVYLDRAYRQARRKLQINRRDQAWEIIRQVYRQTWTHSPEAQHVWANYSNLCILDDHEVHNLFPGVVPPDHQAAFRLAIEHYQLYQAQLRLDYDHYATENDFEKRLNPNKKQLRISTQFSDEIEVQYPPQYELGQSQSRSQSQSQSQNHSQGQLSLEGYGYIRRWGDLTLVQTEFISTENTAQYLEERWPSIISTIKVLRTRRLILVLPKAFLPMGQGFWGRLVKGPATEHQQRIYQDLFRWLVRDNGDIGPPERRRHILLVFGDLHIGGRGYITDAGLGDLQIPFLLTTPITNYPSIAETVMKKAMKASTQQLGVYRIHYERLVCKRNFGLINISDQGFQTELVEGSGRAPSFLATLRGLKQLL